MWVTYSKVNDISEIISGTSHAMAVGRRDSTSAGPRAQAAAYHSLYLDSRAAGIVPWSSPPQPQLVSLELHLNLDQLLQW